MRGTVLKALSMALTVLFLGSTEGKAQFPPPETVLPKDFEVISEHNFGTTVMVEAAKSNDNLPGGHADEGTKFSYSYSQNPVASQLVEVMTSAPEEPASSQGIIRDEPCGKQRYKGGVMTCRKTIMPQLGIGSAPDLVTWNISWMGATSTGMIGVSVSHFVGEKETAVGWIDNFVSRISDR
jgi:hypothetical protein